MAALLVGCAFLWGGAQRAAALPVDTYAPASALSKGRWVKVSVSETGVHLLSDRALRQAGFSDPQRVKVYGYGAERVSEVLNSSFIDDLPQTPSVYLPGKGVAFFGVGPVSAVNYATNPPAFRPAQNPYTFKGYYFLSEDADSTQRLLPKGVNASPTASGTPLTAAPTWLFHEKELVSPGKTGNLLLGEDFKYTPRQTFNFSLPGAVGAEAQMQVSFVVRSVTGPSTLSFEANGEKLPSTNSDRMNRVTDDYTHGSQALTNKTVKIANEALSLAITLGGGATISLANLDYIALTYDRTLAAPAQGTLMFEPQPGRPYSLAAGSSVRLWDVSSPRLPREIEGERGPNGELLFQPSAGTGQRYAAWSETATLPAPVFEGEVASQNLHALTSPDMVIFTPSEFEGEAERLADFHRQGDDSLRVLVLRGREVYNEFSSGSPDAMAFRKCLKMLYDRPGEGGRRLRYVLFMSRPTFDNRKATPVVSAQNYPTLACWSTDKGLSDNDSFTSDDIFGFLDDGSGANLGADRLSVAVGRLPFVSASSAKDGVDKVIKYATQPGRGLWRNNVLVIADDGDRGAHLNSAEDLARGLDGDGRGEAFVKKIYTDEYELVSGNYPGARTQFFRDLDEGVLWWCFTGHASATNLTAEGLVNYSDFDKFYLRRLPIIYAATCNFMRWDNTDMAGAELLFHNDNGGAVAVITANRPVYIDRNGYLTEAVGQEMLRRDERGRFPTVGEVIRNAKLNLKVANGRLRSDANKLRYVFLGDPAMPQAIPAPQLVVDKINGKALGEFAPDDDPPTLMARQRVTVEGHVASADGQPLADFNGLVTSALFDAEESVTTRGNGNNGVQSTFDRHGGRLYLGSDSIIGGRFTLHVSMPSEVKDNFRPAALNMYAVSADGTQEAAGLFRQLYVYGTDPEALPDTIGPTIRLMALNHSGFRNGDHVNPSPMLIAEITDDNAVNLSTAGIGHQMALYLDGGSKSYTDVCDFYTPFADGTPGGSIAYPLSSLADGPHTLRLRVWDTAANSADQTITFDVRSDAAPQMFDVYTDANPASYAANFYVTHDRPDQEVMVDVEVFDMMGRQVWRRSQRGRSDMFESVPVTWDLTYNGGARVPRGIYFYRATLTDTATGTSSSTQTRRLAVTAH